MNASQYFDEGFNCAESVSLALSRCVNLPCECIPKIATGFGAGMRTGSICGAVSGAILAFGLKYGRMNPSETERRDHVNRMVTEFMEKFKREHKTIVCQELLGINPSTEEGKKKYEEENMHKKCKEYVTTAFQLAQILLAAE